MKRSGVFAFVFSLLTVVLIAAPLALQVSAVYSVDELNGVSKSGGANHSAGIVGSFNEWSTDGEIPMVNENGVWKGAICLPAPTDGMIVQATTDDGSGVQVPRKTEDNEDMYGITFKVRLDGSWDDSWGDYEPSYDRTYNSQTNCYVPARTGTPILIGVILDTTKNSPEALENPGTYLKKDAAPDINWLPVEYKVVSSTAELKEFLGTENLSSFNIPEKNYTIAAAYARGDDSIVSSDADTSSGGVQMLTTETVQAPAADQSQTMTTIVIVDLGVILVVALVVILVFAVKAVKKQ